MKRCEVKLPFMTREDVAAAVTIERQRCADIIRREIESLSVAKLRPSDAREAEDADLLRGVLTGILQAIEGKA
jgi:hypothetical protein